MICWKCSIEIVIHAEVISLCIMIVNTTIHGKNMSRYDIYTCRVLSDDKERHDIGVSWLVSSDVITNQRTISCIARQDATKYF